MKTLGQFFRDVRVREGRGLEEVAASVELAVTELEEYESNIRELPFDMVFALSNVLNIRPDEVLRFMLQLETERQTRSLRNSALS